MICQQILLFSQSSKDRLHFGVGIHKCTVQKVAQRISTKTCKHMKHHSTKTNKHMKHQAAVQSARERYISRRVKKSLTISSGFFHDGCCTVHARFEPWRDASYTYLSFQTYVCNLHHGKSIFDEQIIYRIMIYMYIHSDR